VPRSGPESESEGRIAAVLRAIPEVVFAYLFGSRARGEARPRAIAWTSRF